MVWMMSKLSGRGTGRVAIYSCTKSYREKAASGKRGQGAKKKLKGLLKHKGSFSGFGKQDT